MSIPSQRTLKRRLKELRTLIDESKDPAQQRIAYAMETAIRWATEDTVGWEAPVICAKDLATMLRRELGCPPFTTSPLQAAQQEK